MRRCLTISALARTSEVAIALLPLVLLPMVILAGILQPVHEMGKSTQWLAQAMPSRWAFEGLLLLEVADRPQWTPPVLPRAALVQTPVPPVSASPPGKPAASGTRAEPSAVGSGRETKIAARQVSPSRAEAAIAERPSPQDMAERYFPREDQRMGSQASVLALGAMLVALVAATRTILRCRDVH